ncbi:Splicing factor U2af large subunit A-like protein [Drosera capensis]
MADDESNHHHSTTDDRTKSSPRDGRSFRHKHEYNGDRENSRSDGRDRHREYGRERERERGRGRDHRERGYNDRGAREGRRRDRDGEGFGSHDYDRLQDRESGYRGRRRSLSRERIRDQPRETSRSPPRPRSKRSTGFDMGPPSANMTSNVSTVAMSQLAGVPQAMPAAAQNALQLGMAQLGAHAFMPAQAMTQQATRHARRVYVGGLPPLANEQTIAIFFSQVMAAIGGNSAGSGDAVVNVYINHEKKFAFVEMRTVEEASNAMALDGIGIAVRVRRPTDYNPTLAAALGPSQPSPHLNLAAIGLVPSAISAAEGQDRIFVGGIPYYIAETQIKELLESFGPLKGFDLVKDRETGNSRGYGFCVYRDPAIADIACEALNGLKMGEKTLTVRRATISNPQANYDQGSLLLQAQQQIAMQNMAALASGQNPLGVQTSASTDSPTKILCLDQVVATEDLSDDNEYEEILEDMRDECRKFGVLVNIIIPRPGMDGVQIPGVGKVFLEYSDIAGCAKAKSMLGGRKFGGNTVTAVYYSEQKFYSGDYSG